jgi:hypothetical protein
VHRNQPRLAELGFANPHKPRWGIHIVTIEPHRFPRAKAGGCQKAYQSTVGPRPKAVRGSQGCGRSKQGCNLSWRIDMRLDSTMRRSQQPRQGNVGSSFEGSQKACQTPDLL